MATLAKYTLFGPDGLIVGSGNQYLPPYLDRVDIRAKTFWFLQRGLGDPTAAYLLLDSQGSQKLSPITSPLRNLKYVELKGIDNGLEGQVREWCRSEGIRLDRTSSNQ